nr:hypothetical protein [Tanacetum cinerariifolium]
MAVVLHVGSCRDGSGGGGVVSVEVEMVATVRRVMMAEMVAPAVTVAATDVVVGPWCFDGGVGGDVVESVVAAAAAMVAAAVDGKNNGETKEIMTKSDLEDISGLKTCSDDFSLLDKSTDPEMVDLCASMVDPSRNFMPLKPDLSYIGLDEFADKPLDENTKSSEEETKAFWTTTKARTINREAWIHAKVDGKKVIISEASIKRDLHFGDKEDEDVYKELDDRLLRAATTASSLEAECQDTMGDTIAQTSSERVSKLSNDSLLVRGKTLRSVEDRLKLNELMELCTNLQSRVLDLEKTKTTQVLKIDSLKRRVKKLKKKQRSRTHKLKRLYKVGLFARVESADENEDLGEDASKQGRKIHDIDADEDITLVNDQDDEQMFDVNDLQGEEVFVQEDVADKEVNVAGEVNVACITTTDIADAH